MTRYYKVLINGRSCNGGDAKWALPVQREDGTWEPGEWMPEIEGSLVLCARGYHLTREPARWWQEGAECYMAEWDGEHVADGDGGDKIAVRRCRLLRRLTPTELASLQIFVDGCHVVTEGFAVASGSAQVWAYGFATVEAHGSAQVRAHNSARVKAYDSTQVRALGSSRVNAYDSVQVEAHDSATVRAYDSARVWARGATWIKASGSARVEAYASATVDAYDSAQVSVSGFAKVDAYDSAQVWARGFSQVWALGLSRIWASESALVRTPQSTWGQPTVMTSDTAVWVDYRSGVPVVHTAEGRWEPIASRG